MCGGKQLLIIVCCDPTEGQHTNASVWFSTGLAILPLPLQPKSYQVLKLAPGGGLWCIKCASHNVSKE